MNFDCIVARILFLSTVMLAMNGCATKQNHVNQVDFYKHYKIFLRNDISIRSIIEKISLEAELDGDVVYKDNKYMLRSAEFSSETLFFKKYFHSFEIIPSEHLLHARLVETGFFQGGKISRNDLEAFHKLITKLTANFGNHSAGLDDETHKE